MAFLAIHTILLPCNCVINCLYDLKIHGFNESIKTCDGDGLKLSQLPLLVPEC